MTSTTSTTTTTTTAERKTAFNESFQKTRKTGFPFEQECRSIFMTALYNAFHCYATSNAVVVVVVEEHFWPLFAPSSFIQLGLVRRRKKSRVIQLKK